MQEVENKIEIDMSAKELVLMSNLYLSIEYPYNYLILEDVADLLGVSKATAINVTRELSRKGLIKKVRGYISFYYPVKDDLIRRQVLSKLGFFQ